MIIMIVIIIILLLLSLLLCHFRVGGYEATNIYGKTTELISDSGVTPAIALTVLREL